MPKFAEIAIALPIDRTFHYAIPEAAKDTIAIGKRVFVPFGNRTVVGYVVGFADEADFKGIKEISSVIDNEPVLSEEMLKLTCWIKDNYYCSWGLAIEAAVPSGMKSGKQSLGSRTKESYKVRGFSAVYSA